MGASPLPKPKARKFMGEVNTLRLKLGILGFLAVIETIIPRAIREACKNFSGY